MAQHMCEACGGSGQCQKCSGDGALCKHGCSEIQMCEHDDAENYYSPNCLVQEQGDCQVCFDSGQVDDEGNAPDC